MGGACTICDDSKDHQPKFKSNVKTPTKYTIVEESNFSQTAPKVVEGTTEEDSPMKFNSPKFLNSANKV